MTTIIGPHKVNCGSLVSSEVDSMLAGETVAIFYSDPPWGDGNLGYWATMNRKMTGQVAAQVNHDQLYDRIGQLILANVRGNIFIETGLRWQEYVLDRFKRLGPGLGNVQVHRLKYGSGGKLLENLLVSATFGASRLFTLDPSPYRGAELVRRVVGSVATPGGVVLDPCCGMGYTARAAVAAGMRFIGNELNQKRLDKTIEFLRKQKYT